MKNIKGKGRKGETNKENTRTLQKLIESKENKTDERQEPKIIEKQRK